MIKALHTLVVVALALAAAARLEASQVLWLAPCDSDTHRDALTDAVEGALNGDAEAATLETHGPQDPGATSERRPIKPDKTRSNKWWLSEDGKKEFGISEQQSRGLEALFQQMLPTLKANKSELDKQEKALDQLLSEGSSSEPVVAQAIDRVEAARSALSRTRTLMLYRMYRLLTPEQRAKVQAYYERKAQENDGRTARR